MEGAESQVKLQFLKPLLFQKQMKFPAEMIVEFEKIQKGFIRPSKPKIKNEPTSSDFKDGGLKNVDTNKKIATLLCFL